MRDLADHQLLFGIVLMDAHHGLFGATIVQILEIMILQKNQVTMLQCDALADAAR